MKNYNLNDELENLRVGDTLTLEDGSVHEAVKDYPFTEDDPCDICSFVNNCMVNKAPCYQFKFHFKQQKDEPKTRYKESY